MRLSSSSDDGRAPMADGDEAVSAYNGRRGPVTDFHRVRFPPAVSTVSRL